MRSFRSFTRAALALAAATALTTPLLAQTSHKLSRDLREAATDNVAVIVQYNHDPGDAEGQALGKLSGQVGQKLGSIRALTAKMSKAQLDALASDPNMSRIFRWTARWGRAAAPPFPWLRLRRVRSTQPSPSTRRPFGTWGTSARASASR